MASSPTIRILLIAGGQSDWEHDQRLQGDTDLPMSDTALCHVSSCAATWAPTLPWPKVIHSAPDEASTRTAELFGRSLDHIRVKPTPDLAEPHMGLWQGLTAEQIADRHPKVYQHWCQDPFSVTPPEGESLGDAAERLRHCVRHLTRRLGPRPLALVLRPWMRRLTQAWLLGTPLNLDPQSAGVWQPQELEVPRININADPPRVAQAPSERRITA